MNRPSDPDGAGRARYLKKREQHLARVMLKRAREGKTCPVCGTKFLWLAPTCSTTCNNVWAERRKAAEAVRVPG